MPKLSKPRSKRDDLAHAAAAERTTSRRERVRRRLIGLALFGAGLLVFGRTIGHDFVNWDDPSNIELNPDFRGLGPTQLRWMFTTFHMGHYQPLSWVTLAIDYLISRAVFGDGIRPPVYHVTNTLLHAASIVLVYLLARRLLSRAGAAGMSLDLAAAWAALLFGLHPLRVESVAWVTERRDVLSSFLLLLTVLAYVRSVERLSTINRWYLLAILAYAASLLSRAMGVTLPLILLLLDWYPLRRPGPADERQRARKPALPRILAEKIPFVILAAVAAVIAPLAQRAVGASFSLERHGVLERLAQATFGLVFYVWKTVVPRHLSPIYEIRLPIDIAQPRYVLSAMLVIGGLAALAWLIARRRGPAIIVGAGAYALLLAPVLGLAQSGIQEVADRYSYLPGIVLALLAAAGVLRLTNATPRTSMPLVGVGSVAVLVLAALAWRQCAVWRNTTSLWTYAITVSPESSQAQNGYGWVLLEEKRYEEAVAHLRRAIQIEPTLERAHRNLWRAWREQNKTDELLAAYRETTRVHPAYAEAHYNVGVVLQRNSDFDGALAAYETAVRLRPDYVEAHANAAMLCEHRGDVDGAIRHLAAAVTLRPQELGLRRGLAKLLVRRGRVDEAATQLQIIIASDPTDLAARQTLADIMAVRTGR